MVKLSITLIQMIFDETLILWKLISLTKIERLITWKLLNAITKHI
jgi:hypothetical protein